MRESTLMVALLAASVAFGGGLFVGQANAPAEVVTEVSTEKHAAMMIHGEKARLVGFVCGEGDATVIAAEESDFPPCVLIRPLSDVKPLE